MKKIILILVLIVASPTFVMSQIFKLPKYSTFKLPNGLVVNLMEQHEVPVISVAVLLPAGAIYDGEKSGLAALTSDALLLSTKNYSKYELDKALGYVGANLTVSAHKEYASLNAKFAAKDTNPIFDIIKEVLLSPTFDAAEFEKEKNRALIAIERQKESPKSIIQSYFDQLIFGTHVYGNILQGTQSTLGGLEPADVLDFYKTNYVPDGSVISVVGDFSSKDMKSKITKLFSSWKGSAKTIQNLAAMPIKPLSEPRVLLVNKDDAKETTFYVGFNGTNRNDPQLVDITIINTLFGGRFTSMLNDELRVNSGLTYGASSKFQPFKYGGSFTISTFTANETTEAALEKTFEVLDKLHRKGLNEKALASAKNYVKGQFPPKYETVGQLSKLLSEMFWYNLDASYINNFQSKVDALDVKKANEIIDTYFPKENLQIVLIGKASEIKDIAEKYGKVIETEINSYPQM